DAIPTVVPSNEPPLNAAQTSQTECFKNGAELRYNFQKKIEKCCLCCVCVSYMMSWALSCRIRGNSVSVGFFSMTILSRSLQISRPVRATRTFSGR
uniref:Uncharacterized protein n=1 Tax=Neogobius melanostomus TaxID=47308 RepID=A0A8C6UWS4_9GOBI